MSEIRNPSIRPSTHVVIVGGGITGLATAYYLQKQAATQAIPLTYTLLEQGDALGGKIITEYVEGFGEQPFVIEGGPDSFLTQKPWALQLARELGLGDRLLGTNDHLRKVFVLNRSKPTPLPDGVLLIVPTRLMPFIRSPLLSPLGKLRMGMDLFLPGKQDDEDETLADFIRRRLGAEALDKIAEPLMAGIYNAEAERQSLLATFPRFRELEKQHGSLIKGMLAGQRRRAAGHKPLPMFMSLQGGVQELVKTLAHKLNGEVRLNARVRQIDRLEAGGYRLILSDGDPLQADAIVMTTPAYAAAKLLEPLAPQAAAELGAIRYVSTGTISLAYRRQEIAHPLNGFGLVIPASEHRPINAITWTSTKFNHRAPAGYALLRVFVGGSRNPQAMALDDETLLALVRGELHKIMGIDAAPIFHRIYRWPNANPQYDVGHLERVAAVEAALPLQVYVAGSPYRGIGIPDCVHQAQQAAEKVIRQHNRA
jgi:oxygen-dependent protoporphyrinogen oxidase